MTGPDRLRLGVLGCADIARRRVLPAVAAHPDFQLVAVASRDAAKARAVSDRFGGDPVVGYQNLLDRADVDAVYVPLPPALHAEWVERALVAGKHVLAEKPLTTRAADTGRLTELAAAGGRVLFEGLMFTAHPQHRVVREMLDDGAIGALRMVTASFAIPPRPAGDLRYHAELGGGALADLGVYTVRTALMFLGADLTVVGSTMRVDPVHQVEVGGTALLVVPDGRAAVLSYGFEHAYRSSYELWGAAGTITVPWAYTPKAEYVPVLRYEKDGRVENRTLDPFDHFSGLLTAFAERIRGGRPTGFEGAMVLRQAELLDEIRRSAVVTVAGRT